MKAAYFIIQPKNRSRFNNLFEDEGIFLTDFSAEDVPSLTAFVQRDKSIARQDYVCIDVGTVQMWSISHILSAVQLLRRFSAAQLIFVGEKSENLTELYGILASVHHVNCLLTDQGDDSTNEALKKCFAGKMSMPEKMDAIVQMMAQQTAEVAKPLIPPGLVIEVAVAGTMPRCGVTTQVLQMYHYLQTLGWRTAIWDKTDQLLPTLMQYENYQRTDNNVITIHDVDFVTTEMPQYNAYITDCGTLTAENAPLLQKADLSVLVGCTKPWELPALAEAHKLLLDYPCEHLITLASFALPGEIDALSKHLKGHIDIAPYAPDLWHCAEDVSAYKESVLPTLKDICGVRQQKYAAASEENE